MFRCSSSPSPSLVGILLFRNNNGRGPATYGPSNPRAYDMVHQAHRSNPSFSIDEKGKYWRITPDFIRRARHLASDPRKYRPGQEKYGFTKKIVDEDYDPQKLDQEQEKLLKQLAEKRMEEAADNDDYDEHDDEKDSNRNSGSTGFHTRPVKIIDHQSANTFSSLAFHHFLHGIKGLNNSDRRPLVVRNAIKTKYFFDTIDLGNIQRQIASSSENKNNNTNNVEWCEIYHSSSNNNNDKNNNTISCRNIEVAFAVFPHSKLSVGVVPSSTTLPSKKETETSVLAAPVSPFSRAAKHARLVGKKVGQGAANREQVFTSYKTEQDKQEEKASSKKMKNSSDENGKIDDSDDETLLLDCWNPEAIYTTEETILCGGNQAMFYFTLTNPFAVVGSSSSSEKQHVTLSARDCLYIPRGWKVQVRSRASSSLFSEEEEQNNNDVGNNNKESKTTSSSSSSSSSLLPLLFRFSYSPVFPQTGRRSSSSKKSRNNKSNKKDSLTTMPSSTTSSLGYVAADYIGSYGDFYHVNNNQRPTTNFVGRSKVSSSVMAGGERMGVTRPMNL